MSVAPFRTGAMAGRCRYYCSSSSSSEDDDDEEEEERTEEENDDGCSSCSTAEAEDAPQTTRRRRCPTECRDDHAATSAAEAVAAAAATTASDLLDARRLADLLDPERLVTVLDGCLRSEYVRGCVVETWDATLSDHLEAIAHLVLYQTPEHAVSQFVYEQLTELSTALRPVRSEPQRPARVDADRVYGTLRSAARALLATRVDACCRQSMCRAVGLAVAALRANTRPVFSVENFTVEINEAADFANLYCGANARRICAALKDIYDTVMAGEYHPTNVLVQMAVMEKSIRAALATLADARATGAQKTAAQRSLLAELDSICATVRMKNHGCVQPEPDADEPRDGGRAAVAWARGAPAAARLVHFTMSPWRAPIRLYHQQSPASMDRVLKSTVRLVEALVSELFKPCLGVHRGLRSPRRRDRAHRRQRRDRDVHEKQL